MFFSSLKSNQASPNFNMSLIAALTHLIPLIGLRFTQFLPEATWLVVADNGPWKIKNEQRIMQG